MERKRVPELQPEDELARCERTPGDRVTVEILAGEKRNAAAKGDPIDRPSDIASGHRRSTDTSRKSECRSEGTQTRDGPGLHMDAQREEIFGRARTERCSRFDPDIFEDG